MSDLGVHIRTTERTDGDFAIGSDPDALERRRRAIVDLPWVWLNQVHGRGVVDVDAASVEEVRGTDGDALVTHESGIVLAVQTADCVPVALWSDTGVIAVAHAGWRGLEAGVVEATVERMRAAGADTIHAAIGPHLTVADNEFGSAELDRLGIAFGPSVQGTTTAGRPAFDIDAALAVVVERTGIVVERSDPSCTAADARRWFSHRARRDAQRMASVIWRRPPAEDR